MRVEWDPRKARTNYRKHGVRFSDAEGVLFDPLALAREDETSQGEARFVGIGVDHAGKLTVVAFAQEGEIIRLISARCATRKERHKYEAGIRL